MCGVDYATIHDWEKAEYLDSNVNRWLKASSTVAFYQKGLTIN